MKKLILILVFLFASLSAHAQIATYSELDKIWNYGELAYGHECNWNNSYLITQMNALDTLLSALTTLVSSHSSKIIEMIATDTLHANQITALTATDTLHTSQISALTATDTLHDSQITALTATDTLHTSQISALTATDTLHDSQITALTATDTLHTSQISALTATDTLHDAQIATLTLLATTSRGTVIASAAGTLAFSVPFTYDTTNSALKVILNGIVLAEGDYTKTSSTIITLDADYTNIIVVGSQLEFINN